ncbi:SdiA-regulated domain-containing protein [uncultured Endozoicomonas sp.]|uniref:SdiA-regulated domain-containing protein n=1 Tax=uncultured Endozoicomonas sp. TaxID=432652 RepID=UPI00260ED7CD|nr:SdiA-regulated domain-containing protein [uncultured Endozoicomonas sp.]
MNAVYFKKTLILFVILVTGFLALRELDVEDHLFDWYLEQTTSETTREESIWLPDYHVVIDAMVLEGIEDDASGITWSPLTHSLFIVLNGINQVVELSNNGDVLRRIPMKGFRDVEAITWVGGNHFVVADEREQSLIQLTITPNTESLKKDDFPSVTLGVDAGDNKGFEGVAWDLENDSIFVVRERDPMRLYKVAGLTNPSQPPVISIEKSDALSEAAKAYNNDLSGLHYDQKSGHLLVLSHESRLLTEVNSNGEQLSFLELDTGWHGLKAFIPQAEGVTMDDDGNIYILSEPNLFYKFSRNTET